MRRPSTLVAQLPCAYRRRQTQVLVYFTAARQTTMYVFFHSLLLISRSENKGQNKLDKDLILALLS